MLFGIDRSFRITVDDVVLEGEFPLPKDEREIDLKVAERLRFVPRNSIPNDTYNQEYICSLLNHVIKKKPDKLTDFSEVYDFDWTVRAFNAYSAEKKKLDESLKKNNRTGNDSEVRERPGNDSQSVSDERVPSKTRKIS